MSKHAFLEWRGQLQDLEAAGSEIFLVTEHGEKQPTAIYVIDAEKLKLKAYALPAGGRNLSLLGKNVWVSGSDGQLYKMSAKGGSPTAVKVELPREPGVMESAGDTLFVASGSELLALDEKGKEVTRFELIQPVTALAADPSGQWLVAGTDDGTIAVFDREEKDVWTAGNSRKVHEGRVTALHFEPSELRVWSAGTDVKIQTTHVRGGLEPDQRSGRGMHDKAVSGLVLSPDGQRFLSGAGEGTLKAWAIGRGGRPASQDEGAGKTVALAVVEREKKQWLVQGCHDNSIRLFQIDEDGKLEARAVQIHDAYAAAGQDLQHKEPKRRQGAIDTLKGYADQQAVQLLNRQAREDKDLKLKVRATEAMAKTEHPAARGFLQELLKASEEAVRLASLNGLRALAGKKNLKPLELALQTPYPDTGIAAVEGLAGLAKKDELAREAIIGALEHNLEPVRNAAFVALENLVGKKSPDASLIALDTQRADVRQLALVRLQQRRHLDDDRARTAIRKAQSDNDSSVRQTARLVSLLTRPRLAEVLRSRDKDIHRALHDLEHRGSEKVPKLPKPKAASVDTLEEPDLAPLFEALSSRVLETALFGATSLATLEDPRAFGALLQLSRESDASARATVCKALKVLADPRAIRRLRQMLRDDDSTVRDAAFSALTALMKRLDAAEAGLLAEYPDVRKRALGVVTGVIRSQKTPSESALTALRRALDDEDAEVRSEAFKACLNLNAGGDEADTLRFARRSIHADVRLEVLVEAMGRITDAWAWPLVLEFFDDPDSSLRSEAFEFATEKRESEALDILRAALTSRYPDLRIEATKALINRSEEGAQLLLIQALEDEDNTVRQLAVDALATAEAWSALTRALSSEYRNVRLRAATARAELGDEHALEPMLAEATRERPVMEDERELWQQYVSLALSGLGKLGHPDAVEPVTPLLEYDEAGIRNTASWAIAWCADEAHLELLEGMLRHEDPNVRYFGAVGLAFAGSREGLSELYRYLDENWNQSRPVRSAYKKYFPDSTYLALMAVLNLGKPLEDRFLAFLDHPGADIHQRAFLMAIMLEMANPSEEPERLIAALASEKDSIRLQASRGLDLWATPTDFEAWVVERFNHRGEGSKPGEFDLQTVRDLAGVLAFGKGQARMRLATIFWFLNDFDEANGVPQRQWRILSERFSDEILAAREQLTGRTAGDAAERERWRSMVLGALVGMARLPGWYTTTTRQSALRRLQDLAAEAKPGTREQMAAESAFVLALSDVSYEIRHQVFQALQEIGSDPAMISAEALATGMSDVGEAALRLLTKSAAKKDAIKLLEDATTSRTDYLEYSAFNLLKERTSEVSALEVALDARSQGLRSMAVSRLLQLQKETAAQKAIGVALESPHQHVREEAAIGLAHQGDDRGFEVVQGLLWSDQGWDQNRAANGMAALGGHKALQALFDRDLKDTAGTAELARIYPAIGNMRNLDAMPRLLQLLEDPKRREYASGAAWTITGYDQHFRYNDDDDDESWMEGQHPRHHQALAGLAKACFRVGDVRTLRKMVPSLRWCPDSVVDDALAPLARHAEDALRHAAAEAIGYRAEYRDGPVGTLRELLGHHDTETRFLAAEGLAKAGHGDGVAVLLTAVNAFEDLGQRQRAVEALGKVADERALDTLVDIAADPEHELREVSVEAIGRMPEGPRSKEIFQILKSALRSSGSLAERGIRGLRYFNTAASWKLIRKEVESSNWSIREEVARALEEDPSPAANELLENLIVGEDDEDVAQAAIKSLRRRLGSDNVELDYVLARSGWSDEYVGVDPTAVLKNLAERGEPARLFRLVGELHEETAELFRPGIRQLLIGRSPLPVAEALQVLNASDHDVGQVAAVVLGRAGSSLKKAQKQTLEAATVAIYEQWLEERRKTWGAGLLYQPTAEGVALASRLEKLLWACKGAGAGTEALPPIVETVLEDPHVPALTRQALLATVTLGKGSVPLLKRALAEGSAEERTLAAQLLRAIDDKEAGEQSGAVLTDPQALAQLLKADGVSPALREAASDHHRQGALLARLVRVGDVETLEAVAENAKLNVNARLGAVEALGAIGAEPAQDALRRVATGDATEDEMKKAAWRAFRRGKRRMSGSVERTV